MNAVIGEKTLREINLLPFEMAVEAGAWMAMAAYNKVNGIPSVEQSHVLGIVKDEWGFDGVLVSDWFATKRTVETANAGVDLEMPGPGPVPRSSGGRRGGGRRRCGGAAHRHGRPLPEARCAGWAPGRRPFSRK